MSVFAAPNLTSSDGTTAQFEIGAEYTTNGTKYTYCKATAATIAAYSVCTGLSPAAVAAGTTTTATALGTAGGFACVPQFDIAASEYFWAVTGPAYLAYNGSTTIKVLAANVTAGNLLYSTATAGVLDDDSSGSTIPLLGATLSSTVTTQAATAFTAWKSLSWAK